MKAVKWIVIGVIVVGVLIAARWLFMTGETEAGMASPFYERVVQVERGNIEVIVSANGVIEPINRVEIKSKASGQIVKLPVEEGDYIRQGGLIAELDQTIARNELEQARAELMVAEANLRQAENNLKRGRELFEKQLISAEEMDRIYLESVRAQAQLVRAKSNLQLAEERMDETIVRSPIDGIILTKDVEGGQIISSGVTTVGGGTLISTVANMDYIHVRASVDEVDIGKVQPGQKARIVADAYPDRVFIGEVIRVAPQGRTEQNITTFRVIILVKNEGGFLKAGMSADVEVEIARRENVVMIPNEALQDPSAMRAAGDMGRQGEVPQAMAARMQSRSPGQAPSGQAQITEERSESSTDGQQQRNRRIVLAKQGETFEPRPVTIGISNYEFTEIVNGLSEGEEILIRTFSRARQAGLEWQERIRGRGGFSGFGR